MNAVGSGELSVDCPVNTSRVFQVDPGGKGPGAVVEESHLQDHRSSGRCSAGILQVIKLA